MRPRLGKMAARAVDGLLELSVVGSYSRLGPAVRSKLERWVTPGPLAGRSVVVTGASSGLGLAVATGLASLGARLCLVGRDPARLQAARLRVDAAGGPACQIESAELSDLAEVAELAERILARFDNLDVLVHNAGALLGSYQKSAQGNETTIGVHLLAPFLLTERLRPLLTASGGRVITVTSAGMYTKRHDLSRLEAGPDEYDGVVAYARAKRAQVVLTEEWQRRYGADGLTFYAVHPGWADTPGLRAGLPGFARRVAPILRTPEEGAGTIAWLAGGTSGLPPGGTLWLDRQPRSQYRLPWTWVPAGSRLADGIELWMWCERRVAPFLARTGGHHQ